MSERIAAELDLVRTAYPDLKVQERDGVQWMLIPDYPLPDGWSGKKVDVAFKMPAGLPGQQPYAFWVPPGLTLADGSPPGNTSGSIPTPFGDGWLQFSWELDPWQPGATPEEGTNMRDFARSFRNRFLERS